MSPFVKLQPGYVTFGEHNIKFPHASLVATAVGWRYQCSVVPYYERRWCMFSIMVFFRCFYNSQWYRCQPCRAVSDIFTALSLVSFRWEDDWWCFSKNYWSLTSLQLSAPPSTTRWTTIISSPGSWIVCTQLTMASALWRCPVFHCLLLLLVCFHCSQGELPWNCCKQKCTFFLPPVILLNPLRIHLSFVVWMRRIYWLTLLLPLQSGEELLCSKAAELLCGGFTLGV